MEDGLEDDLNSAPGVAALFDLARDINRARDEGCDVSAPQTLLRELAAVLGLTLTSTSAATDLAAAPFVELLLEVRRDLRTAKQYALGADCKFASDSGSLGITLEDGPEAVRPGITAPNSCVPVQHAKAPGHSVRGLLPVASSTPQSVVARLVPRYSARPGVVLV